MATIDSNISSAIKSKFSELDSSTLSDYNLDVTLISNASNTLDYISGLSTTPSSSTPNVNKNGVSLAPQQTTSNNGVKESNPPAPDTKTYVSQSGQPQTPPTGRSGVDGTQIGKTNKELVHVCDFTIGMKLEVCGETFQKYLINETLRMESLATWTAKVTIPFLDEIKSAYDTIKAWYDMIMQYVNVVKKFIDCMQQIIQAITEILTFIATLPANLIGQAMGCVSGFAGILTDAVNRSVDGIMLDIKSGTSANAKQTQNKVSSAQTRSTNAQTTNNS